jgi:predicted nuclease of restriction endonuclease-like RecB superfamily
MNNLRHSEIALETAAKQARVVQGMINDLERSIEILGVDIRAEELRVRVFDAADLLYPILARTLRDRSENLKTTVAALRERLRVLESITIEAVATAA